MTSLDERIDELIEACGGHVPPDYARFYIECDALMSGVGPRTFCVSVATRLTRVMTAIREFSEANPSATPATLDDDTKRQLLIAYNGFKLLQGFFAHLPPEMRSFIAQQTGVPVMGPE